MANSPLVLIHDALWTMLEAHAGFTELVPVGNRIKLTNIRGQAIKPRTSTADMPEVRIIPTGGLPHLQRTSNSSTILKRWEVQAVSGETHIIKMMDLEWEVFRALSRWDTHLGGLKWPVDTGNNFVIHSKLESFEEGVRDTDLSRGSALWSSIWAGNTELVFATNTL